MSKKGNRNALPAKSPVNGNGVAAKPSGGLLKALFATAEQAGPVIGVESLHWDEQLLTELIGSLPDERRAKFETSIQRVAEFGKQLKDAVEDFRAKTQAAEDVAQANRAREVELEVRHLEIVGERDALDLEKKHLAEDRSHMISREKDLELRELNARNGFYEQNCEALKELRAEISRLESVRRELHREIDGERSAAATKMAAELAASKEAESLRIAGLREREALLAASQEAVDAKLRQVETLSRAREQLEAVLRKQLDGEYQNELRLKDDQLSRLQKRLDKIGAELDAARANQDEFAALEQMLKGKTPGDIIRELEELRSSCKEKERKIAQLESARSGDDLPAVRKERDRFEDELRQIRPELEELKQRAHASKMVVMEREQWALEKRVLEKTKQLLAAQLDDLESRIKGLTDAQKADRTFPELGRMDTEHKFQTPAPVEAIADLKLFTTELQHRIAATQPSNPLFFRLEELQLFVGGLAMSQLHVLQGISGTGKTSLAKAFAEAVGGTCRDIAVQAGWRDRGDLLGHYNAFEKRYYEKDCLQALYQAGTPCAKDRVNIVLLDEMNLSRPEQYFADFLSALEKKPGDRWVSLMESAPANAPRLLREGREIEVLENVWFIGTANQDETTNELADKTHDRAFVMELPRHEDRFEIRRDLVPKALSHDSLVKLFERSQKAKKQEIENLLGFIGKSELTSVLAERFNLGWGNRFERQALRFIPVVIAAGGTIDNALDHLLASRLFRSGKVVGRYDINRDDLDTVESALMKTLKGVSANIVPVRCLEAIEADRKRLERGA